MSDHWCLVLPFRGGPGGKSRLAGTLPRPELAPRLALAMAFDVARAALASPRVAQVVLLTGVPLTVPATLEPDPRLRVVRQSAAGLNGALSHWLARAGTLRVAVLQPDVPAVTPAGLTEALDLVGARLAAGAPAVVVPDTRGTGSVMLAGPANRLRPRFGPGSAKAHEAAGALRLDLRNPRLRTDVDTADDLARALALGVGPYTTAVFEGDGNRVEAV